MGRLNTLIRKLVFFVTKVTDDQNPSGIVVFAMSLLVDQGDCTISLLLPGGPAKRLVLFLYCLSRGSGSYSFFTV